MGYFDGEGLNGNTLPGNQAVSQSIDWYHEGESRTVEIGDLYVTVRFIGRKGRRARIALVAPAGASFCQRNA
jgi:hypothetical protein